MLRTISIKDSEPRTPCPAGRQTNSELSISSSLDEALAGAQSSSGVFEGEKVNEIASYVAGWIAAQGIEIVVLDGANRFDPYAVSFFARRRWISPETLLKESHREGLYLLSDVRPDGRKTRCLSERRSRPSRVKTESDSSGAPHHLFGQGCLGKRGEPYFLERSLKKVDALAAEGVSFLLFQSLISPRSKRTYLMKRLFQFSHLAWKISLDDEGPRVTMEKGPELKIIENCKMQNAEMEF